MTKDSQLDPVLSQLLVQVGDVRWALHYLRRAAFLTDKRGRESALRDAREHVNDALANTVTRQHTSPTGEPTEAEVLPVDAAMLDIATTPDSPLNRVLPTEIPLLLPNAIRRHELLKRVRYREPAPDDESLEINPTQDQRIYAAWDVSLLLGMFAKLEGDIPRTSTDDLEIKSFIAQVRAHVSQVVTETRWPAGEDMLAGCKAIQELWPERSVRRDEFDAVLTATAAPIHQLVTAELATWRSQLPRATGSGPGLTRSRPRDPRTTGTPPTSRRRPGPSGGAG